MVGSFSKCLEKPPPSSTSQKFWNTHTTQSSFTAWIYKRKSKVNPWRPKRVSADLNKACSI